MTQPEWPQRLTAAIADQVQRLRHDRKMSAQQLADATAGLGHPIPRSVIANLESGRRDTVSVAELLVLARALRVPPLLLIFPLGKELWTEVLPGVRVGTWAGALWFTGEQPTPVQTPEGDWTVADYEEWEDAATRYFRRHEALLADWIYCRRDLTEGNQGIAAARRAEDALREYRSLMRKRGLEPDALPDELAHVDEAPDGER